MPDAFFSCPRCSRLLQSRQPLAANVSFRCPDCGACFRLAASGGGLGTLLAWLLFGGMILVMGTGIGLAMLVHSDSPPPQPEAAANADDQRAAGVSLPVEEPALASPPPLAEAAAPRRAFAVNAPPPLPVERSKTDKIDVPKPKLAEPQPPPKPPPAPAPEPAKPAAPPIHWLPAFEQGRVDRAIDRGVEYLRRQQHFDGTWGHQTAEQAKRWTPGMTALAALTLLECGVPADDPHVQRTAKYLRRKMPALTSTYSIAAAILFFDRLGHKPDVPRIRTLALRLIAGQKPSGGWDYFCPKLTGEEELGLLARLYKDRPRSSRDLFLTEGTKPMLGRTAKPMDAKNESDLYRPRPSDSPPLGLFIAQPSGGASESRTTNKASGVATAPRESAPPETHTRNARTRGADATPLSHKEEQRLSEKALQAADRLSPRLKKTPALNDSNLLDGVPDDRHPRTDNSNTQFAVLGLLAAEKYDVPMERALALIDWRFRSLVNSAGGWDYQTNRPTSAAMTCAGPMGLALKHGLVLPHPRERGRDIAEEDPLIHRALLALDGMLERYFAGFYEGRTNLDKLDLYCMWSVERVAVLYNLRRIGDLEWYPAGVQLLLSSQQADGSWNPRGSRALEEPAIATSFALLFFKRSNLSPDLTRRLRSH